jgi:hypothetical protein
MKKTILTLLAVVALVPCSLAQEDAPAGNTVADTISNHVLKLVAN